MKIANTTPNSKLLCYVEASGWQATLDEDRYGQLVGNIVRLLENQNLSIYLSKEMADSYDYIILDKLEHLRRADLVILLYHENDTSDQFFFSLGHCIALGKPYLIIFLAAPFNTLVSQLKNLDLINLYRVISYHEFMNSPNLAAGLLSSCRQEKERVVRKIDVGSVLIPDDGNESPYKAHMGDFDTSTYYVKYYDSMQDTIDAVNLISKRNSFLGVNLTVIPISNTSILIEQEYPGVMLCDLILPKGALLRVLRQVVRFSCFLEEPVQIQSENMYSFTTELYSVEDQQHLSQLLLSDFWLSLASPPSRTRAFDPNPRNLIVNSSLVFVPVDFRTNFYVHPLSNIAQFLGYYPSLIVDGYKILNEERENLGFNCVPKSAYLSALGQTFLRRLPFQLARSDLRLIQEFMMFCESFANESNLLYLIDGCLKFGRTKVGISSI